jgi:hypothetical protein
LVSVQHQKKQGRGIVVINPHAGKGIVIEYETNLQKLFCAKTIKDKIQAKIKSYSPEKEVLVAFQTDAHPRINSDNCILHSLGSTTFPVSAAVRIFEDIMSQFQSQEAMAA